MKVLDISFAKRSPQANIIIHTKYIKDAWDVRAFDESGESS